MTTYAAFPALTGTAGTFTWTYRDPRCDVTMRQARLALLGTPNPSGTGTLLDATNAAVAASTDATIAIWWDYSPVVSIDEPHVYEIGSGLGLTQAQVETLFSTAATL